MKIPLIISHRAAITLLAGFKATTLTKKAYEVSYQGILVMTEQKDSLSGESIKKAYIPDLIITEITTKPDFIEEMPLSDILACMQNSSILNSYLNKNNTIKDDEVTIESGVVITKQYYYLQIHTHPYMPEYGVIPSAVDIKCREQLAAYTDKVCTLIVNESMLKIEERLFTSSLFSEKSLIPLDTFEVSAWFNDKNICHGKVKETVVTQGELGTFLLYEDGEVLFVEGDREDDYAIRSLKAGKFAHFVMKEQIFTPEEILIDDELFEIYELNPNIQQLGLLNPYNTDRSDDDLEEMVNLIYPSNFSFIPLKTNITGLPDKEITGKNKIVKGNSLVSVYLESCDEGEFKRILKEKSEFYLESVNNFNDLVKAVGKLIKMEAPKPTVQKPIIPLNLLFKNDKY